MKSTLVGAGVLLLAQLATGAAAQAPRDRTRPYDDQSQTISARTSDRQIQQALTRLRTDADALRQSVDNTAPRGRAIGNRTRQSTNEVGYLVDDLLEAADHLSDHISRRQVIRADVDDLLHRGALIQTSLGQNTGQGVQAPWTRVQRDLDAIASGYGLSADWRAPDYNPGSYAGGAYDHLTGTYRLDPARSDNPRQVADRAISQVPAAQRSRMSNQMYARLEAPSVISIDRRGNRVTIASSLAPEMTFNADGQAHAESENGGGSITTRASVYGDRLEVAANGGAGTDYSATFEPLDNGQSLRLTRRLFDDSLHVPIIVQSIYRRTSETAEWNVYDARTSASDRSTRRDTGISTGTGSSSVIPDGSVLVATLDDDVDTSNARRNDRVTLTVRNAPRAALEGAVIQGYLASEPSRTNGRTGVSIDFNEIRLTNGQTSDFSGRVESVRGPNGQAVVFDADQDANPNGQRDQAIQRGAIGAAIGAVIGAVAGGGKGAAIGAAIGGGGGAATVYMGQDQNRLPRGTEFTIRTQTASRR
ncbi:MAG: YMGG-like glycine zipper-containing protein [Vicinamibacterales bacterium]